MTIGDLKLNLVSENIGRTEIYLRLSGREAELEIYPEFQETLTVFQNSSDMFISNLKEKGYSLKKITISIKKPLILPENFTDKEKEWLKFIFSNHKQSFVNLLV